MESITNIFHFYEDKNFKYDPYDILKGIIEEYKTKLKYISVDGYINNYLEKIKKHINSGPALLDSIGKILKEIKEIIKESKAFEKNFADKILEYFGDAVDKLFDEENSEKILKEFKNIFQLCNDNVLSNGKSISGDIENFIKNSIQGKLKKESYRNYADQIATIKTQLPNNIILWNYLDDSKLKTVQKLMQTI